MSIAYMNYITIFSTRTIREGALFHNGLERKDSEELRNYFDKYYKEIVPEISEKNWWSTYKQYGIVDEVFFTELRKDFAESPEKEITVDDVIDEFINSIKNARENEIDKRSQDFFGIDSQIGECLRRLISESEKERERKKEREKKIAERSKVYCLPAFASGDTPTDYYYSYAVELLKTGEGAGNDNNGWIQALYDAAKALSSSSNEGFELILILHDKDLGGKYEEQDVFVLEDVSKYISEKNCKIVFFKHTSNDFVRLVLNNGLSSYDVYLQADKSISKYAKWERIVGELDNLPYDSSCDSKCILSKIEELEKS